ncbi:MAG: hypothetical protein J6D54_00195 [Olsenella sp.]|nr:hypothetical protein [Olsenella sp.]
MAYDVDYDYPLQQDEEGVAYLPKEATLEGNLYRLPNGKYLPSGLYRTGDGGHIIYEPKELSPYADILFNLRKPVNP